MKTCKKCNEIKIEADFPKYSANGKTGHRGICRVCWNLKWSPIVLKHSNRYYHENKNGYADKARLRTSISHHRPGANLTRQKRNRDYESKHPERNEAKVAIMMAVRNGKLIPQPCIKCGQKAQAHHDDYSKPMDVIWLCPKHHGERHRLLNRHGDPAEWPEDLRVREWPV